MYRIPSGVTTRPELVHSIVDTCHEKCVLVSPKDKHPKSRWWCQSICVTWECFYSSVPGNRYSQSFTKFAINSMSYFRAQFLILGFNSSFLPLRQDMFWKGKKASFYAREGGGGFAFQRNWTVAITKLILNPLIKLKFSGKLVVRTIWMHGTKCVWNAKEQKACNTLEICG